MREYITRMYYTVKKTCICVLVKTCIYVLVKKHVFVSLLKLLC